MTMDVSYLFLKREDFMNVSTTLARVVFIVFVTASTTWLAARPARSFSAVRGGAGYCSGTNQGACTGAAPMCSSLSYEKTCKSGLGGFCYNYTYDPCTNQNGNCSTGIFGAFFCQ